MFNGVITPVHFFRNISDISGDRDDSFDSRGWQKKLSWDKEMHKWEGERIRRGQNNKLKNKSERQWVRETERQESAERKGDAEIVAHSSRLANNRVTESETDEGDGEEEEKARQREEDLVRQRDHSNTDLFTD